MTSILIVAGEVSGDIHAGNLLAEIKRQRPGIEAFGVGGDRLIEAGLDCVARSEELAHMGLFEVLRELPRIRRVMARLVEESARRRPPVAVLVDSPDFNLRLAARLRGLGIEVLLYISPQLWAWRRGRVRTVRRLAREVICILPFEVAFYERHDVRARYVGHPLVDDMAADGLIEHGHQPVPGRIALLPGSRAMEVRRLLPAMVAGLRELPQSTIEEAILVEAPGVGEAIDAVLASQLREPRLRRIRGQRRRIELAQSSLAWTASGTATLECALLDVPMVVGYRLQTMSAALARLMVSVPHAALVNLIAERRAAPELMQRDFRPARLADETRRLLAGGADEQRRVLAVVRQRLGGPGASGRAADAVSEYLGG
jgi:lipid-A-disaccharide synthase